MKTMQISNSNFKDYFKKGYYYVDKTLFIEELLNNKNEVILLPRPRRFGKTLNLSMLKYYFDINEDNKELFKGLNIEKKDIYEKHINKYPVIFLTFTEIGSNTWEDTYNDIKLKVSELYKDHSYLLKSDKLEDYDKKTINSIINKEASFSEYKISLYKLSEYLRKHYDKEVVILLDEYDSPINRNINKGYYDNMIVFLRDFISSAFKGNQYLFRGVITGILRIAKESIFSGANNIDVYTILDNEFSDRFGFTEDEVIQALKHHGLGDRINEVREWYNGYTFGNSVIYNPYSIANYTQRKDLEPYWLNSGNNSLIENLLDNSDSTVKNKLEELIKGNSIEENIDQNIVFSDLSNNKNLWSLLLFSGYLRAIGSNIGTCILSIPNKELKKLYNKIVEKYFTYSIHGLSSRIDNIAKSIAEDNINRFKEELEKLLLLNISSYDISKSKEDVYHIILLLSLLKLEHKNNYEVKSNSEAGKGRYDICIIPKNINKIGYVIEFKVAKKEGSLKDKAEEALKQIENKKYYIELVKKGIKNIKLLGIAFEGKNVYIIEKNF